MRLSIVIPAFNEEARLPACLASIDQAMARMNGDLEPGDNVEVIVADNNSTDATAARARAARVKLVFEPINQISKARNAGAAAATGDWLLFIDADSQLHLDTFRNLLDAIRLGHCAGGGCVIALDRVPWWACAAVKLWNVVSCSFHWAAGSFLFCRADAFDELGGFSEELYASEEIDMSRRLKAWGKQRQLKFVILKGHPHVSSGRKFELYGAGEILMLCARSLFRPFHTVRNKGQLGYFYESRR